MSTTVIVSMLTIQFVEPAKARELLGTIWDGKVDVAILRNPQGCIDAETLCTSLRRPPSKSAPGVGQEARTWNRITHMGKMKAEL